MDLSKVTKPNNGYKLIHIASHAATKEKVVVYQSLLEPDQIWFCTLEEWERLTTVPFAPISLIDDTSESEILEAVVDMTIQARVTDQSTPEEKIELFQSLFAGRADVYAKRYESAKTGATGYVPDCAIAWSPVCPKSSDKKFKCSLCDRQRFIAYDEQSIKRHLRGELVIGVYPMFSDESCRFLVFDFDAKNEKDKADLIRDIGAIRAVCAELGIDMPVERSRSGEGYHFWIFFSENISAKLARKFATMVITYAMNQNHQLSFATYDRLIPNQDTLPKGGFGNLIALPLQREPRKNSNSVFVDHDGLAYDDQWAYLSNIKKYTLSEIESFMEVLSTSSEFTQPEVPQDDEKPWASKKKVATFEKSDFPQTAKLVYANMIYVEKFGFSSRVLHHLKRMATFSNPEFYKAQALRLSTHDKPRIITCAEETEQYIGLPRGLNEVVTQFLSANKVAITTTDETTYQKSIDIEFNGELRGEQQAAVDALLSETTGTLSATTAFGKTVIGAHLIAQRKMNTLILVHRTNLLEQWRERLQEFLTINEEPFVEYTPTGRKRKKEIIGQIGAGKTSLSGVVDVAVIQSLITKGEVKDLVKDYGMVIVDECHHVSAFSFEQVLKAVNAKYVYGLTATPTRKDGHHPIIYMQCGKIRYQVDAKEQAEKRPFNHVLVPRFTRFLKPSHREGDTWYMPDVYQDLQESEQRNQLLVRDVVEAVAQGRTPLILSERTDHVRMLASELEKQVNNVIVLLGGASRKQSREALQRIHALAANESFVIVATGRYVGEGFDLPRLDTLFLAMPVSWKGTVQQYTGRLHRLFDNKTEVQVYDYVDIRVPMLERMYQKRLKGYAAIGYKSQNSAKNSDAPLNAIFNQQTFVNPYDRDLLSAKKEIVIVSPFLTQKRILEALNKWESLEVAITVATRPASDYPEKDQARVESCIRLLLNNGVIVSTRAGLHQKCTVIDQQIIWYGGIDFLGYGSTEQSVMRLEDATIANELIWASYIQGENTQE